MKYPLIWSKIGELSDILCYVFNLSLQTRIFPNPLKIVKVTPVFKTGDLTEISNNRLISVLPCFPKILERIMHIRLYSYLANEKILYSKQFGFQKGHSTEHPIAQLADQIHESFKNDNNTLFYWFLLIYPRPLTLLTMNIIKKPENYGIKDTNLAWSRSYLENRKQCTEITNDGKSNLRNTASGVPPGPIIEPLLFLVYVNDLPPCSVILNPVMFADDTNLFYKHKISQNVLPQ